jgi:methyl-accepting chemotaxis protein
MSIKIKVLLVVMIMIVLIVGLNYWIFNKSNEIILNNITDKSTISAEKLSRLIEGFIISHHNIIKTTSIDERAKENDIEFLKENLETRKELYEDFLILYLSDKNGDYFTTQDKESNIADRSYFKRAMETGEDVIERVLSKTTNEFIIVLGSPVKENSKNVGFVGGTIKISLISDIINSERENIQMLGKNSYAYLINSEGTIIAHPNDEFIKDESGENEKFMNLGDENFKKMHEKMKAGESGYAEYDYDGARRATAYVPIKIDNETTWSIAVTSDFDELKNEYKKLNYSFKVQNVLRKIKNHEI